MIFKLIAELYGSTGSLPLLERALLRHDYLALGKAKGMPLKHPFRFFDFPIHPSRFERETFSSGG